MSTDYRPPITGDQPNPYQYNSPEYDRFNADRHTFQPHGSGSGTGSAVPGGGGAAIGGAVVGIGALAAFAFFLHWFYSRTKAGRMIWWAEKRLYILAGVILFTLYVLPLLVGVVGVPLYALVAPEHMPVLKHGPIFILPLVILYGIFFWLRKRLEAKRSFQLPASISEADPLAFREGNDIHRFYIHEGSVARVTRRGSKKRPSLVIDLTGATIKRIRMSVATPPAVGTALVFAAYSNRPEEPVVVCDGTTGSTLFVEPLRPWDSPGFKRMLIAIILHAIAMWLIAMIWAGLTMYFKSRTLAVVGLIHGIATYALIFGLPLRIREALRWPANSVMLYESQFLPALVRQASGR